MNSMNMEQTKKPGVARRAVVGVAKSWSYSIGLTSTVREGIRIWGDRIVVEEDLKC